MIYSFIKIGKEIIKTKQSKAELEEWKAKRDVMSRIYNHSAETIQKHWKGYNVRKSGTFDSNKYNPIYDKIIAFVRGWKVRKILKWQEIQTIIKKLSEVSLSIKRSQFNPLTRNFIYDFMTQK